MRVEGSVVAITGAAGGIGAATALEVLRRGAAPVLLDIDRRRLDEVAAKLAHRGESVLALEHDVTDPGSWEAVVRHVMTHHRRIDVLVNNAGLAEPGAAESLPLDKVERQIAVNLMGTIHGCRAVLPVMRAQRAGKIVNVASLAGIIPMPGEAVYSATKYAIRGYTLSLAAELRGSGVGACTVCPASVSTPQLEHELDFDEAFVSFVGAPMAAERVARAIVRAIGTSKPEVLVPAGLGVLSRIAMAFPRVFFLVNPLLHRLGTQRIARLRALRRREGAGASDAHDHV